MFRALLYSSTGGQIVLVQHLVSLFSLGDCSVPVAYPGILFGEGGGVQQIQLRAEDRENGDLGAVAPSQGFWRQL